MTKQNVAEPESLGEAMNKTELFFQKNGRLVTYIFLALLVIAALVFGYRSLIVQPRIEKAAEMIAQAQARFEAENPDFELALQGDANGAGFLDVIDQYGSTPSGNLAKHYAGICYLRTGDLENAAAYLAKFSPVKGIPGALINAQNYGLQGDVAVEQQDYAAAVKFYEKAVAAADNNMTAPMYLRKAGLAEQAQGNTEKAAACYERILTSYPASMEAREAEKLLGGATK
ncbi:tetratricopeptide repeat protein [uncultured Alistipes sp.]|uniref:tetratricopeptide repeat protein n=1 Tax=uncultured Alistipes sp. TaxID=538949 RepID=UPI0026208686|nr:tetratricopeptide repeat protein [uncultured Alistipes sp.]